MNILIKSSGGKGPVKLRQPLIIQTVPIPIGKAYEDESLENSLFEESFFAMKTQEIKSEGRRLIGRFRVRARCKTTFCMEFVCRSKCEN